MIPGLIMATTAGRVGGESVHSDDTSRFVPVTPTRVMDTRAADVADRLDAPETHATLDLRNSERVDRNAVAVAVNVVTTESSSAGFVQVGPTSGFTVGTHSNINVDRPGLTIAGLVITKIGTDGTITLHSSGGGHLVVDLIGYFVPSGPTASGRFTPLSTPQRFLDTRDPTRVPTLAPASDGSFKLRASQTLELPILMSSALPGGLLSDDASAVIANVTVLGGEGPGYVQVFPSGASSITGRTSSVNYIAGEVAANLVIVPVGPNGAISIHSSAAAHVIVDVVGFFTGHSSSVNERGLYVPLEPQRLVDTRVSGSSPEVVTTHDLAQLMSIPSSASGVSLNAAIVNSDRSGYLQLLPTGRSSLTSNVNADAAWRTRSNAAISTAHNNSIDVIDTAGGHYVLDATGYFLANTSVAVVESSVDDAGFVVPVSELMAKPMSGSGWQLLKSAADRQSYGVVDLGDRDSLTQSYVLAGALVHARTGDTAYRDKVIEHIRQVCGTQTDGPHELLAVARTLFGYVAAAEIVGMPHSTKCYNGQTWREFLETIRTEKIAGHGRWETLEFTSADTSNNWGAYALSSHLAVSYALGDDAAIRRDTEIFKRFVGDRTTTAAPFQPTAGYGYNDNGLTWDMTPRLEAGINPTSSSDRRSGALIEDALRSPSAASVACCTVQSAGVTYQEEALDGLLATAQLLRTHGSDYRNAGDQALRRAYEFMIATGGPGPNSLTRYLPYAINYLYGTNHPTQTEDRPYRHLGYGSWLFTK